MLAELLNAIGAVTVTVTTINYSSVVAKWVGTFVGGSPQVIAVVTFWVVFLTLLVVVRLLIKQIAEVVKWERLHWAIQGFGLVLGGIRGLWWSGFLLMALSSSGFVYVRESVEQQSVFGPRLLVIAHRRFHQVTSFFPSARGPDSPLIPPVKAAAK